MLIRTTGDIIALSPPLIIQKAEIDQLFDTLAGILKTLPTRTFVQRKSVEYAFQRTQRSRRSHGQCRPSPTSSAARWRARRARAPRRCSIPATGEQTADPALVDRRRARRGRRRRQAGAARLGGHAAAEARPLHVQLQAAARRERRPAGRGDLRRARQGARRRRRRGPARHRGGRFRLRHPAPA